MKILVLIFYYTFGWYLPDSIGSLGKLSNRIQGITCKSIFEKCGLKVNMERGENFGTGKFINIGDNS